MEKHGKDTKYFIVPMTRLLNNSILLNNLDQRPKAPEEPQIIFRYDAKEEYNLNMRYGRRSKVKRKEKRGQLEKWLIALFIAGVTVALGRIRKSPIESTHSALGASRTTL